MSASAIEWTERTWNPIVGCSIVSPGCTNCYAMKMASRIQKMNRTGGSNSDYVNHYDGTTKSVNGKIVWTGKVATAPDKIFLQPLSRKAPTTYFVNSMSDLFHEGVPDEWIDRVFAVMALSPQHTFQVLTKRAQRIRDYFARSSGQFSNGAQLAVYRTIAGIASMEPPRGFGLDALDAARRMAVLLEHSGWPLKNVWLGVSTERQQEADERIPLLLQTPAAIRFISAEPLLGPIDMHLWMLTHPAIDWVIAGGESGQSARPMSIQWVRELRRQCAAAKTSFFFKQWGEWCPARVQPSGTPGRFAFGDYEHDREVMVQVDSYPRQFTMFGSRSLMERVGKKAAGRHLDGVLHNGFPTRTENLL